MCGSYEESDMKAGFYYDLKFVMFLLYVIFLVVFVVLWGLSADFAMFGSIFLCIIFYLDLQAFIEVRIPRYGWKCSKNDYKLASALLIISPSLIPIGRYFLDTIAVWSPLFFILSVGLETIPMLLGIVFALTCYLDFGNSLRFWKKNEEITNILLKHSYFYRKIFGRKTTNTPQQTKIMK